MTLDEVYDDVPEIVSCLGVRITGEVEPFLAEKVALIPGEKAAVVSAFAAEASAWFRSVGEPPRWIQDAEWPMHGGEPMMFLGQIDLPTTTGLFHDDAAAYLFLAPTTGATETVIQIA